MDFVIFQLLLCDLTISLVSFCPYFVTFLRNSEYNKRPVVAVPQVFVSAVFIIVGTREFENVATNCLMLGLFKVKNN